MEVLLPWAYATWLFTFSPCRAGISAGLPREAGSSVSSGMPNSDSAYRTQFDVTKRPIVVLT
ncbi:MAG: hypothetical protein JXR56_07960 [Candidatus Cloacimonetes bacterium]|nr:hypothetical protein [Candidatus Cloacimonadota bacterium]